jgi:hypothetical protein
MKHIFLTIAALLFMGPHLQAQQCSRYYPMTEGTSFQYTNYSKNGKESGTINYKITAASSNGDTSTATMNMTMLDEKGKEVITSDYKLSCSENAVHIDYQSLMSNDMLKQFGDMDMDITGTDIELPNDLAVGQNLADANINMKMNMGGVNMNMNIETVNRKVEARESITTPAGTFDCFVISSETKSKMMMANNTFPSRMWLAEGVGMVKQETYNKNGKLMGSMLLTQFSN